MASSLLLGQSVYAQNVPGAEAIVIDDDRIVWIGDRSSAKSFESDVDVVVDAQDLFIAPAFVDAHVHLSATGLHMNSLDLTNSKSFQDIAQAINEYKGTSPVIFGHGWDDSTWTDGFADIHSGLKVRNASLYLTRIDSHSAIVFDKETDEPPRIVSGRAHEELRQRLMGAMSASERRNYIETALQSAAEHGVTSVHENAGPIVSSLEDLAQCLELGRRTDSVEVIGYWGDADFTAALEVGAAGAAGDYSIDGSLGSRTALLHDEYQDAPGEFGNEYLSGTQIAEHLVACTQLGIQAGFHVIGDAAATSLVQGIQIALEHVTMSQLRTCRHRVEHLEMVSEFQLNVIAESGFSASVQPVFDEYWGNPGGMYEQRVGQARTAAMNPFSKMLSTGINVAFGSDSPVTPINPWLAIKAAVNHHQPSSRMSVRAAFNAHTRGGHRAARNDLAGTISVGSLAHLALWKVPKFADEPQDNRRTRWSTDVRSGVHPLPDLEAGIPECVATVRNGLPIHDPRNMWEARAS